MYIVCEAQKVYCMMYNATYIHCTMYIVCEAQKVYCTMYNATYIHCTMYIVCKAKKMYCTGCFKKKPAPKSFSHYPLIYCWKSMKLQKYFG